MESISYIQLRFKDFVRKYPEYASALPVPLLSSFMHKNPFVRIYPDKHVISFADSIESFDLPPSYSIEAQVEDVKPSKRPEAYYRNKSKENRGDKE